MECNAVSCQALLLNLLMLTKQLVLLLNIRTTNTKYRASIALKKQCVKLLSPVPEDFM